MNPWYPPRGVVEFPVRITSFPILAGGLSHCPAILTWPCFLFPSSFPSSRVSCSGSVLYYLSSSLTLSFISLFFLYTATAPTYTHTLSKTLCGLPSANTTLPTTTQTISPADLFLPRLTPDSPTLSSSQDHLDSPFFSSTSLPFPITMDSTQRKSPEFPLDPSSPNFSYDFSADGTSTFDFANNYTVYPHSPRMDFAGLALSSPHPPAPHPGSFFNTHFTSSSSASLNPGGSPNSLTSVSSHRPLTPLEGATISPPLTYPAPVSGSEMDPMDDTPRTGANSPTGGRAAQHHLARGAARYSPVATRPARPAARKSTAATRRNLRREEDDVSDEEGDVMADDVALGMDIGAASSE